MAAGQGFKTFNTGDVLSAADVNGYLMQGVLVFTDATARDAAITSPQEGQFAYTKDNNSLWYYTGSAWAASGATGDIEGVTAGTGISGGGTSGTVTITNSMATAIDAKGDLVVGTGADAFSRLAIGTNGYILTADSAQTTGMKWAAAAGGGGKVLQVVQATSTTYTTTTSGSNNYVDTSLSVTITPSATNSKILIACYPVLNSYNASGQSDMTTKARIVRNIPSANTVAYECTPGFFTISTGATNVDRSVAAIVPVVYLDSPSTTSATTYKLQFGQAGTARTGSYLFNNADNQTSVVIAMEIGA